MPVQKDKLAQEFIQYLKTLEDDMLVTAGLSQISAFGSAKSNVRTDGVVDKIAESDDNKLVNALDNVSSCMINIFKKLIYLEKQRSRTLTKQLELAKIDTYMLKYRLEGVDAEQVTIINRDFLMKSDQVFDKKLQQAGNFGLYNPESGLSYTAKIELLNSMHASYLRDTLDPAERNNHDLICWENDLMLNNKEIPQAYDYHKHEQHITEHNNFRMSPEVRCLKDKDEKAWKMLQEAIEAHIQQHKKFVQQSQQGNVLQNAKDALKGTAKK